MLEATGNIFEMECDAVCITTNGFVKKDGRAVMGKGCAKTAADQIPTLTQTLGRLIQLKGNHVHQIYSQNGVNLYAFPTKPVSAPFNGANAVKHMLSKFQPGDIVPGWACVSDLALIQQSAYELVEQANKQNYESVLLPRPGCGAGELDWKYVKPILAQILDDRFICCTFSTSQDNPPWD